ncbi:MAG: hypothetical protein A3K16_02515 [Omnitrophica bacterium RIFCSPLOWO2_01_FULL_45_24]|nr:MAG: hypothetical protein A3K16_02515 [Omnitrophica bacterium RIFCSPLOWO2_01_FULL_45_24]
MRIPKEYKRMPSIIRNAIFFIGWMLSPLTFWNDAFVNIPIAYLCAVLLAKVIKADFLFLTLAFYWLSNVFGVLMMYFSGKSIMQDKRNRLNALRTLLITVAAYSILIIILNRIGILKPI